MRDDASFISESVINGVLHVRYGDRWVPVPSGADGPDPSQPNQPDQGGEQNAPQPGENTVPPADGGQGGTPDNAQPDQGGEGDGTHVDVDVDVPSDLADSDEAALRELHQRLGDAATTARSAGDPDAVARARADQARIVEEVNRRRDAEAERVRRLAELDEAGEPALPEPIPALAGAGASAAQLASVRDRQTPADQSPPPPAQPRRRQPLLAAAGTEVVPAGHEMSYAQLGAAIDRAKRGRGGQTILASLPAYEEEPDAPGMPRLLSERNGATLNDELINEAVADWRAREFGAEPIQASARQGAICQPFDIIREIPDAFNVATPVADIFPARPAGRGGFQFTPSGVLADVAGAVTLWDEGNQAAVDATNAATWKPCVEYKCPDTATAVVEAIVQCVTFPITLEMSNPERVRNLNNALGALRARTHEGRVLQRIDQLSHPFVFSGDYGALPAVIEAINTLVPQLEWRNRQEPGSYVMILPPAVVEVLTIDRANRAYGTEMESQDVMQYVQANCEGINRVVEALDPSLGGEPGVFKGSLPPVGNQAAAGAIPYTSGGVYRIRLVDPAAAIYAETGEMNAGVLRDANLIRQNRTGYFSEQFFFLAKHGPQPWATIDIHLCADGARAGLVDPLGCLKS